MSLCIYKRYSDGHIGSDTLVKISSTYDIKCLSLLVRKLTWRVSVTSWVSVTSVGCLSVRVAMSPEWRAM